MWIGALEMTLIIHTHFQYLIWRHKRQNIFSWEGQCMSSLKKPYVYTVHLRREAEQEVDGFVLKCPLNYYTCRVLPHTTSPNTYH